ncbi:MAG: RNase adapter RapZ [Clostridia bacterium]|nr:RNase adapter RapZ [Clostridia bacterium]
MEVVILTGLSGAGKTKAKGWFEDRGYYSVDNMPPALIGEFIELSKRIETPIEKACFVVDPRGGSFFSDFEETIASLKAAADITLKVVYLYASKQVIIRRFDEVRRLHPLSVNGISLVDAIDQEIELFEPLKKHADLIIDTSRFRNAKLYTELENFFMKEEKLRKTFTLNFMSFGFKNGVPIEADWIIDSRFIPNPYYVEELKKKTGNDSEVQDYVLSQDITKKFIPKFYDLVDEIIDSYIREGKYSLTIAFGCTGGQHRSVTLANIMNEKFSNEGIITTLEHRDLK